MKTNFSDVLKKLKLDRKNKLLVFVLVGILLLIIVWPASGTKERINTDDNAQISEENAKLSQDCLENYIALQEVRLENILSKMEGVGEVDVMITASASKEKVIEKDVENTVSDIQETDGNGGSRKTKESGSVETSIYVSNSSGSSKEPYVVKELEPVIEGVLVAASWGGDEFVVDEITQAVSVLFDIPMHKIKVVKMES